VKEKDDSSQPEQFLAGKGWFEHFKKRYGLHNVKTMGEATSADVRHPTVHHHSALTSSLPSGTTHVIIVSQTIIFFLLSVTVYV